MKRKEIIINCIHKFADGKVMTHAEFLKNPPLLRTENNIELGEEAIIIFGPHYREKREQKLKREFAEERKAFAQQEKERLAKYFK